MACRTAVGLHRMVEQAVQRLGDRVVHVAGHAVGAEADLLGLLLARGIALGIEDAGGVAHRGGAGGHGLTTTALEPTLAPSPTVKPPSTFAPAPTTTPRPKVGWRLVPR